MFCDVLGDRACGQANTREKSANFKRQIHAVGNACKAQTPRNGEQENIFVKGIEALYQWQQHKAHDAVG